MKRRSRVIDGHFFHYGYHLSPAIAANAFAVGMHVQLYMHELIIQNESNLHEGELSLIWVFHVGLFRISDRLHAYRASSGSRHWAWGGQIMYRIIVLYLYIYIALFQCKPIRSASSARARREESSLERAKETLGSPFCSLFEERFVYRYFPNKTNINTPVNKEERVKERSWRIQTFG